MGYYTSFSLSTVTGNAETRIPITAEDADGNPVTVFTRTPKPIEILREELSKQVGYNPFEDSCKWYDHDKDMMAFSKLYPDVVFALKGEGEESGDIWVTYYKNGKRQHCKAIITYDEYDASKLI